MNEDTTGLPDYFPKGSDLSLLSPERLAAFAIDLNARPCKILGWDAPADRCAGLLPAATNPQVLRRLLEFSLPWWVRMRLP